MKGKIGPLDLLSKRDTPLEAFSDCGSPGEWTVPGYLVYGLTPCGKNAGPEIFRAGILFCFHVVQAVVACL